MFIDVTTMKKEKVSLNLDEVVYISVSSRCKTYVLLKNDEELFLADDFNELSEKIKKFQK